MAHVHTEPGQHDITVSAYIALLSGAQPPSALLHRHRKLGIYLQFGGHIELDEDPWQAAAREIVEESGYELQLKLLQPAVRITHLPGALLHPYPLVLQTHRYGNLDHYHSDIAFALITAEPPRRALAAGESSDIRPFSAAELRASSAHAMPDSVKAICLHTLEQCLDSWVAVPCETFAR